MKRQPCGFEVSETLRRVFCSWMLMVGTDTRLFSYLLPIYLSSACIAARICCEHGLLE